MSTGIVLQIIPGPSISEYIEMCTGFSVLIWIIRWVRSESWCYSMKTTGLQFNRCCKLEWFTQKFHLLNIFNIIFSDYQVYVGQKVSAISKTIIFITALQLSHQYFLIKSSYILIPFPPPPSNPCLSVHVCYKTSHHKNSQKSSQA